MLKALRQWLNGTRDFNAGVVLFSRAGGHETLVNLFAKGATDYTRKRLEKEILSMVEKLKAAAAPPAPTANIIAAGADKLPSNANESPNPEIHKSQNLYDACKKEVDRT